MTTPSKKALRSQIANALTSLSPAQVVAQSAAVFSHLATLPAYASCTSAAIYLPMDGGAEVDTWPIVADLMSRGAGVAIPKVDGPKPADMRMLRLSSLEEAKSFPRTKWGIPEPDQAAAASMEVATEAADMSVLLVPAVAFDARCGRLGERTKYTHAAQAQAGAFRSSSRLHPPPCRTERPSHPPSSWHCPAQAMVAATTTPSSHGSEPSAATQPAPHRPKMPTANIIRAAAAAAQGRRPRG